MKKFLILALAICLCACAKKPVAPEQGADAALENAWTRMQEAGDSAPEKPYRLQLSLRFGEEGDTRRVTAILWGNDPANLRLDVMAGVGVTVAKIWDHGDKFVLYAPRENKAYYHEGTNKPLLRIGAPLPLDLPALTAFLNGRYGEVFGRKYALAKWEDGKAAYELDGPVTGEIILGENDLPEEWIQSRDGWRMTAAYDDDKLPRSLKFTQASGKRAILLVKERETPAEPFAPDQLELSVPDDATVQPLSKYRAPAE